MFIIHLFFFGGILFFSPTHGYLAQLAARLPLEGTPSPPGSLWPLPKEWEKSVEVVAIASKESFTYWKNVDDCEILNGALERYSWDFLFRDSVVTPGNQIPVLRTVQVNIATDPNDNLCSTFPQLDLDPLYEAYNLSIAVEGSAKITSKTVWGALRGLETFSQLIWKDPASNTYVVNVTNVMDAPRFPHRGIMIDTARHFVGVNIIEQILDAMSYNKFNVLHWHIVDDQSFPFVSQVYPELSKKGAYLPELIYEPKEVQSVITYARNRGIRVILEFDTPGHTQGFGKAFSELLTPCYGDNENPGTPNYPNHAAYEILDPTKDFTYTFMTNFFREIYANVSKDNYIHLGMDEVYYACWESSPEIQNFMNESGYTEMKEVQQYYTEKHLENVKALGAKSIIWQDPIDFGVVPDKDVLIQVWKGDDSDPNNRWQDYLDRVLKGGYNVIFSSCWYLNYVNYGESWKQYYECDPVYKMDNISEEETKLILGGEANMWAEYVDATNILQKLFPFSSAVAERLWSPYNSSTTDDAKHRLDEHRCRLLWRGLPAQPIYNGYCLAAEKWGIIGPYKHQTESGNSSDHLQAMSFYFIVSILITLTANYYIL